MACCILNTLKTVNLIVYAVHTCIEDKAVRRKRDWGKPWKALSDYGRSQSMENERFGEKIFPRPRRDFVADTSIEAKAGTVQTINEVGKGALILSVSNANPFFESGQLLRIPLLSPSLSRKTFTCPPSFQICLAFRPHLSQPTLVSNLKEHITQYGKALKAGEWAAREAVVVSLQ
jgi:hypothetical protein